LMYKLKEYDKKDVYSIELGYEFDRGLLAEGHNTVGKTLLSGNKVVAVGGVHIMWDGVGEAWALVSPKIEGNGIVFARYAKKMFDAIIKDNKLTRVQATIHASDVTAAQFASWLGFESEGVMRKYGMNGEDYVRVARVS